MDGTFKIQNICIFMVVWLDYIVWFFILDETRQMYNFLITLSYMDIGLYWYQKGTINKWTYDLTNHLMVDLETIIALATMTYIAKLDVYEFPPRMKKNSMYEKVTLGDEIVCVLSNFKKKNLCIGVFRTCNEHAWF